MLKHLTLLSTTILVFGFQQAEAAVRIGEAAPDFKAVNVMTGEPVALSALKGKTVILEWTNHECPYVRKHYDSGNMQKVQDSANADGVEWITVVSSAPGKQGHVSAEQAKMLAEEDESKADAKILDESGEIGKAYDAKTTPHMFVIDPEGKVAYMGAIDDNSSPREDVIPESTNYVLSALENLKSGKPADPASTAPYGCAVKY